MSGTLQRIAMARPLVAAAAIDASKIPEDFVGQAIAPDFQVDAFDFDFPIFGNEGLEAEDDFAVGLKGEFKEIKISESQGSASLYEHGVKAMISRAERQAAAQAERQARAGGGTGNAVFNLSVRYATVLRQKILRRREILIARMATTSANYTSTHVLDELNVRTATDVREKIMTLGQIIADDSGQAPNTAIVGRGAKFGLDLNSSIGDLIGANQAKLVTQQFLVEYLGIPNVRFASALSKKTAKSKAAPIWNNFIWIGYVDPAENSSSGTFARNFWTPYEGGGRSDATEIEVGNERNLWLSYAEQFLPVITGKDFGGLIPTTSA